MYNKRTKNFIANTDSIYNLKLLVKQIINNSLYYYNFYKMKSKIVVGFLYWV